MELGLRVFFYHGVHGVSRRLHGVSYFNHKARPDDFLNALVGQELRSDGEHEGICTGLRAQDTGFIF